MSDLFYREQREGFDIKLFFYSEEINPKECFDPTVTNIDELLEKINSGELEWLRAYITASKAGIKLSHESLGGICYPHKELKNFITDGYYEDMVGNVIIEAKKAISLLTRK